MWRSWILTLSLASFLLCAVGCGIGGKNSEPQLSGVLYFSQDSNANGLYRLNLSTGAGTLVGAGTTTVAGTTCGLTEGPSATVLFGSKPIGMLQIQANGTGAVTLGAAVIEGLAYNPNDGLLYGASNMTFFTLNQATGNTIANLPAAPVDIEGLAADASTNVIYGIGDSMNLYKYTISTGLWSVVGNTGINWNNGGLAYNPHSGALYAIGMGSAGNLYILNKNTAMATLVGPTGIGGNVTGGLAFVAD
jgi:hypothetical protein